LAVAQSFGHYSGATLKRAALARLTFVQAWLDMCFLFISAIPGPRKSIKHIGSSSVLPSTLPFSHLLGGHAWRASTNAANTSGALADRRSSRGRAHSEGHLGNDQSQLLHPQHVPDLQDRGEHLWDTLPGYFLGIVVSRRLPLP
jgi:hypothetical protein